ncbi:exopolyphosphatase [bacterium]|nr:exopolyphosphatase [bacterium]
MRLFTNSDFDGVLSAAMIADAEHISEIKFVHPKDMQDGIVDVEKGDIIANLPFHENAGTWFDHHGDATRSFSQRNDVKGIVGESPSAARLIFEYYDSELMKKYTQAVKYCDKYDSANLDYEETLKPEGWILLGMLLDPRTEMEDREAFSLEIIQSLRKGMGIDELLELPSVKGRARDYIRDEDLFKKELMRCTRRDGNVSITDFRGMDKVPVGNRFLVYALFARTNVNVRLFDHEDVTKVVCAVGKSIFDRSNPVHIGDLMGTFGGGGLEGAGTCTLPNTSVDGIVNDIIKRLKLTKV